MTKNLNDILSRINSKLNNFASRIEPTRDYPDLQRGLPSSSDKNAYLSKQSSYHDYQRGLTAVKSLGALSPLPITNNTRLQQHQETLNSLKRRNLMLENDVATLQSKLKQIQHSLHKKGKNESRKTSKSKDNKNKSNKGSFSFFPSTTSLNKLNNISKCSINTKAQKPKSSTNLKNLSSSNLTIQAQLRQNIKKLPNDTQNLTKEKNQVLKQIISRIPKSPANRASNQANLSTNAQKTFSRCKSSNTLERLLTIENVEQRTPKNICKKHNKKQTEISSESYLKPIKAAQKFNPSKVFKPKTIITPKISKKPASKISKPA